MRSSPQHVNSTDHLKSSCSRRVEHKFDYLELLVHNWLVNKPSSSLHKSQAYPQWLHLLVECYHYVLCVIDWVNLGRPSFGTIRRHLLAWTSPLGFCGSKKPHHWTLKWCQYQYTLHCKSSLTLVHYLSPIFVIL